MIEALKTRIAELEAELARAASVGGGTAYEELMDDLERHVEELEARGGDVPKSALALVRPAGDDEVEDQFDNMPI